LNDIITIKAKLKILTKEEGGKRKTGIASGYMPNHVFEFIEEKPLRTFIGQIVFEEKELIFPEDEKIVTVRFLKHGTIEKFISIGRKWWINEAYNKIGVAEILEVIPS
jgi:hypothetical protein